MDFKKQILGEEIEKDKYKDIVENIIKWKTIYDDDSKMMKKNDMADISNYLSKDQIKKICRFKYSGWGNFSLSFLNGIRGADRQDGRQIIRVVQAVYFREEIDLINADR